MERPWWWPRWGGTSAPPAPAAPPIDTSTWTPYTSRQYGFRLKHPPGWTAVPAEQEWTLESDANRLESTGQDGFMSPTGEVWVTVWSTPTQGDIETWEGVGAWVERYCQQSAWPCPGIHDRSVRLCNESRDCHPGLLVPFLYTEYHALFTGGDHAGRMVGAAVWRPEEDASVAPYGGARRLLEAFLSTMDVCPAKPPSQPRQGPSGCP